MCPWLYAEKRGETRRKAGAGGAAAARIHAPSAFVMRLNAQSSLRRRRHSSRSASSPSLDPSAPRRRVRGTLSGATSPRTALVSYRTPPEHELATKLHHFPQGPSDRRFLASGIPVAEGLLRAVHIAELQKLAPRRSRRCGRDRRRWSALERLGMGCAGARLALAPVREGSSGRPTSSNQQLGLER